MNKKTTFLEIRVLIPLIKTQGCITLLFNDKETCMVKTSY